MATRTERVVLQLDDQFSSGMARAAAATALLNRQLRDVDGTSVRVSQSSSRVERDMDGVADSARRGSADLNQYTGRLRLLTEALTTIGPAAVPIGAAAVPAIAGLTAGLGAAAGAAGVALLAFNGVSDALKALNAFQLEPTAANLEKLNQEMERLGPSGENFVRFLDSLEPQLRRIQMVGRNNLFPGVEEGITWALQRLPEVRQIVRQLAQTMGDLAADAGHALAGSDFDAFFEWIRSDGGPILDDFGRSLGNVVQGIANIMVAINPLTRDFTGGLERLTAQFAEWTAGLQESQGFQEFLDYVREQGPEVLRLIGEIGEALVGVAQAAAPVGDFVIDALTVVADVLGSIANSDAGSALLAATAGVLALNRASILLERTFGALGASGAAGAAGSAGPLAGLAANFAMVGESASAATRKASSSVRTLASDLMVMGATAATAGTKSERELNRFNAAAERTKATLAPIGKSAALIAGLGVAATGAADGIGLTNTASLGLMGTMAGPWGAAVGVGVGLMLDLRSAANDTADTIAALNDALQQAGGDPTALAQVAQQARDAADNYDPSLLERFANSLREVQEGFLIEDAGPVVDGEALDLVVSDREEALELLAKKSEEAAARASEANRQYANSLYVARAGAQAAATGITQLTTAMYAQRDAALAAFSAETQWRQALKDARALAKENEAGIRGSSEAALANRGALEALAAAWNNQDEAVKNNVRRQREARDAFIQTATGMGVPIGRAKDLARELLQIPTRRETKVNVEVQQAKAALQSLYADYQKLKDKSVTITTYLVQRNLGNASGGKGRAPLPGQYATGGYTGAGPKFEPAGIVHRGEVVIPQELVRRDWDFLRSRYGHLPGFADGGVVGGRQIEEADRDRPARISYVEQYGPDKFMVELLNGAAYRVSREGLKGFEGWQKALRGMRQSIDDSVKALTRMNKAAEERADTERSLLDDMKQARESAMSGVAGGLTVDVFGGGESQNPWTSQYAAGSPGAVNQMLQQQRDEAKEFVRLVKELQAKGLSGPALAAIIGSGDIERARAYAALPAESLATFQTLYGEAQGAVQDASGRVADALGYTASGVERQERYVASIEAEVKELRQDLRRAEREAERRHKESQAKRDEAATKTGAAAAEGTDKRAGKGKQQQKHNRGFRG